MASRKIVNNIDSGLWIEDKHGVTISTWSEYGTWTGKERYVMNFHQGEMPAFNCKVYDTLEQLETAMREFEPDLRKWRYREIGA